MYINKPPRKPQAPIAICATLFAIAATLVILSALKIGWNLGEQIGALLCIVIGIEITTRYLMTEYEYRLNGEGEQSEMAVIKRGGSRELTVCHFDFSTVMTVQRRGKLREMERKYGRIHTRYSYCVNMRSPDRAWIYFTFNEKRVLLEIEANEVFFAELQRRVLENSR